MIYVFVEASERVNAGPKRQWNRVHERGVRLTGPGFDGSAARGSETWTWTLDADDVWARHQLCPSLRSSTHRYKAGVARRRSRPGTNFCTVAFQVEERADAGALNNNTQAGTASGSGSMYL